MIPIATPIPLVLILIPLSELTKIHDSNSNCNSDSSSRWFRFWFRFQCFPRKIDSDSSIMWFWFQFRFQQTRHWFRFWFWNSWKIGQLHLHLHMGLICLLPFWTMTKTQAFLKQKSSTSLYQCWGKVVRWVTNKSSKSRLDIRIHQYYGHYGSCNWVWKHAESRSGLYFVLCLNMLLAAYLSKLMMAYAFFLPAQHFVIVAITMGLAT